MHSPLTSIQFSPSPLDWSRGCVAACQVEVSVFGQEHWPEGAAIVACNHRSILDPFVVMLALGVPIRFACHYYMTRVPGLQQAIAQLNCLPLGRSKRQQIEFFRQAETCLQDRTAIGVFPEGADSMTVPHQPRKMAAFHRGFAHLALRSRVNPLPIVPVAICPRREYRAPDLPLALFRWFDPNEPSFRGNGIHPVVMYREVDVKIAPPIWVTNRDRHPDTEHSLTDLALRLASRTRGRLLERLYGDPAA